MTAYYCIDEAAAALIRDVLPTLSELVDRAGERMAAEVHGTPDAFEVETCQTAIMHALADFLANSEIDHSEDHIWGVTLPHHLRNVDYARAFFVRQFGRDVLEGQGQS